MSIKKGKRLLDEAKRGMGSTKGRILNNKY